MLEQDILGWDGKSADHIAAIYDHHHGDPQFISGIIGLIDSLPVQKGVTWLLKRYFEQGGKLRATEIDTLYSRLPHLQHWESRLHLLQSVPYMPIAETHKKSVECFLRNCLVEDNKFVRAWAYNAFHELSVQHKEYAEESSLFLELAMRDEAPSVKARIRNILKRN